MWALAQGESDVTGLAERVGGALPAVSQHLTKLRLAGARSARREGRRQVYFVDDPDIVTVVRLLVGRLTDRAEHAPYGTSVESDFRTLRRIDSSPHGLTDGTGCSPPDS